MQGDESLWLVPLFLRLSDIRSKLTEIPNKFDPHNCLYETHRPLSL